MVRTCGACNASFSVDDDDRAFLDRVSPVIDGKKFLIPSPTLCPDCRQQRRIAILNESYFYTATCGLCHRRTMTEHPKHAGRTIYCRDCYFSDRWDSTIYGRSIDFSRPFFPQLFALIEETPRLNLLAEGTNINSDYIHYAGYTKNCYLVMHADYCEDCYYGYGFKNNVGCVDGFYNLNCQYCYDCIDVHSCYDLHGSQDCVNCSSSSFLRDCIGCKHCFLCVGLRNAEYYFENTPLPKAEYERRMQEIQLESYSQYHAMYLRRIELERQHAFKALHTYNLENSSGDYLQNCKDTRDSFDCEDVEAGRYLYQVVTGAKNVYDIYQYGLNLQESYECSVAGTDSYQILFTHNAHNNCSDLYYCWFAQSSKHCFGCANIYQKQYCILNTQYTKQEYEVLVPRIIELMRSHGEWGEFFPTSFSPFGYNKTTAALYYPLQKSEVLARGWKWDDASDEPTPVLHVIAAKDLPDHTCDVPDDILNWAVLCEQSGKPFKITPQELRFYREHYLPIPRRSPQQRHIDRFSRRNPRRLFERMCARCERLMKSTYNPNRSEVVVCEECYWKEMY